MPLICIASPKGGVGKTTVAANLAHALRRAGRQALAIDFDPQSALRLHFGVPLADGAGFAAELVQGGSWRPHIRQTPAGVALLPHGTVAMEHALAIVPSPSSRHRTACRIA